MPDNHSSEATEYRQKHRRYVNPQSFRQRVKYVRAGIEALQHLFINDDHWIAEVSSEQHLISVSIGRGNPSQTFTYRQLAVYLKENFADTVATFAEVSHNYEDDEWS